MLRMMSDFKRFLLYGALENLSFEYKTRISLWQSPPPVSPVSAVYNLPCLCYTLAITGFKSRFTALVPSNVVVFRGGVRTGTPPVPSRQPPGGLRRFEVRCCIRSISIRCNFPATFSQRLLPLIRFKT